jgi:cystathionine beta-synthase
VVILPDGGRGYLSKVYDDGWMLRHGFLPETGAGTTLREVVAEVARRRPPLLHVHPDETVTQAALVIAEYGTAVVPVLAAEEPRVPAQIVGSVSAPWLADLLGQGHRKIGNGEPVLPILGADQLVTTALSESASRGAVTVVDQGRPVAVLTTADLLSCGGERASDA